MEKKSITMIEIIYQMCQKFPKADAITAVKEYFKLRDDYLVNGYIVKEPLGKSAVTLRRVSSPRAFNVTETSTRSVKVVTKLNPRISSDIILKTVSDQEYSKLLSNGRI